MVSSYAPWKHQAIKDFPMFSRGLERECGIKWANGWKNLITVLSNKQKYHNKSISMWRLFFSYIAFFTLVVWKELSQPMLNQCFNQSGNRCCFAFLQFSILINWTIYFHAFDRLHYFIFFLPFRGTWDKDLRTEWTVLCRRNP